MSWNLVAAVLLKEIYEITGITSYLTTANAVRDFMYVGPIQGRDFYAPKTNLAAGTLAEDIDLTETVFDITQDGAVALPGTYPYTIALAGETITVTGSPGAGQLTVTRSTSATTHTSGDRWEKIEPYMTGRWPHSTSHMWNNNAWHRLGDLVATGTVGTDQIEYGLPALYKLDYSLSTIKTAYEAFRALPHNGAVVGSPSPTDAAFAALYNSAACWPGYLRLGTAPTDRFYGSYYDAQGAGTLGGFKAKFYPADFAASLDTILRPIIQRGSLLDEHFDTRWSVAPTYNYSTKGVIPIASAGLALIDMIEGVA